MRKFFLGAALVAASFGMAQSADAATVMDVDGVSTVLAISDYEGTYNGTMDQIKMRGEDYDVIILSSNEIKFRKSKEKAVKRLSLSSFFVCY